MFEIIIGIAKVIIARRIGPSKRLTFVFFIDVIIRCLRVLGNGENEIEVMLADVFMLMRWYFEQI